jgi:hypothetical protein
MTKSKLTVPQGGLQKNPKFWVLMGLLVLIGYVMLTNFRSTPALAQKPKTLASHKTDAKTMAGKQNTLNAPDPVILISKLKEEPEEYESGNRNLFVFYAPPPPTPKVAENKEPPAPPPPVCGDGRCQGGENYQICPSDCPPPPPPEISLKFIGYLMDKNRSVAFLTDGKEVFMGRENDIIANKYRILKITEQGVELGYLNLNTKQSRTIPFEGNNKS